MRGSQKRSAVVLCGRNLRASPFDRVETKNLCLLVRYGFLPPLASVLHAASFYPSGHKRTLRLFKDRPAPEPGALGCLKPPPSL